MYYSNLNIYFAFVNFNCTNTDNEGDYPDLAFRLIKGINNRIPVINIKSLTDITNLYFKRIDTYHGVLENTVLVIHPIIIVPVDTITVGEVEGVFPAFDGILVHTLAPKPSFLH